MLRCLAATTKYRNKEACNQDAYLDADLYPVLDWRGVSMSDPIRPVQQIRVEERDFSLDKAMPQRAAAIDEQIKMATMRATIS